MGRLKGSISHKRTGSLKWCYVCQRYKHFDQFGQNKSHSDGLSSECKSCRTTYGRRYQQQYYSRYRDRLLPKHRQSALKSYYNAEAKK